MKLSRKERWVLSNQYRILAALDKDEASYYKKVVEILERGYELDYPVDHIYDDEDIMTYGECVEVRKILDMFSSLKYSYEELEDKSGIETRWLKFSGFSGNTETKYFGYVQFLVEREGYFKDLDIKKFDSHMPTLQIYRAMLHEWENSADEFNLTKSDIIRITSRE